MNDKGRPPTRLVVIQGSAANVYDGTQHVAGWNTGDADHLIDTEYAGQVLAEAYTEEWMATMTADGRVFPLLGQPGDDRG